MKKEDWVAGGFYSGRNVEVFYQVFPGTLSTLGYFHSSFKELLPPGRGSAGVAQQCPVGKSGRDSPSEWPGVVQVLVEGRKRIRDLTT